MRQYSSLRFAPVLAASLALAPLAAAPAAAQSSTTRGFNLGGYLEGAQLSVEGNDPSGGGGLGLRIGYGINRIVTLFLGIDGTAIEVEDGTAPSGDWHMAHFDCGARFHFANTLRSWVPYLEAAITGRAVGLDPAVVAGQDVGELSFSGAAFSLGGGIALYLKENLAIDIGLVASGGEFNEIEVGAVSVGNLDVDANSSRFRVGLVWWK